MQRGIDSGKSAGENEVRENIGNGRQPSEGGSKRMRDSSATGANGIRSSKQTSDTELDDTPRVCKQCNSEQCHEASGAIKRRSSK